MVNFKPTKKKIVVCLIVFIVFTIIGTMLSINFCVQTEEIYECTEDYCPNVRNCSDINSDDILLGVLTFGIPSFVISYVVYSLFEGKKAKSNSRSKR